MADKPSTTTDSNREGDVLDTLDKLIAALKGLRSDIGNALVVQSDQYECTSMYPVTIVVCTHKLSEDGKVGDYEIRGKDQFPCNTYTPVVYLKQAEPEHKVRAYPDTPSFPGTNV